MFRPFIKQKRVLLIVASINLMLVFVSYHTSSFYPEIDYDLKIEASTIMRHALDHTYKKYGENKDSLDLFKSGIIGVDSTESNMTTKKGYLNSKRATTNPNFAAVFIDAFTKIGLSLNNSNFPDTIAVSFTGSFPGANIAFLSACKAANIYPIIISSIGSSSWGANQTNKTWLDIEKYLVDKNYFKYRSAAFSLGGDNDRLDELEEKVKNSLIKKITDNGYPLIQNSKLKESILSRISLYNSMSNNYKAYVNIGGSSASLGDSTTSKMYLPGLIYEKDYAVEEAMDDEYDEYYQYQGTIVPVIDNFIGKIPVINIKNINNLKDWYNLPYYEEDYNEKTMEIGANLLFGKKEAHNFTVIWICVIASFSLITWLAISSIMQVNNKMKEIDDESII